MKIYKLESEVPDYEYVYVIANSIPEAVEKFLNRVNEGLNGEKYEASEVTEVIQTSLEYELIA